MYNLIKLVFVNGEGVCVALSNWVVGDEGEVEESGSVTPVPAAGSSSARAARRKTDLMPTLPSPRDLTPRPMRSPGRAYSMSRLDILAQPRKPRVPVTEAAPARDPALSRSMTHLAQQPLRRGDTSRSMVQLSGPPVPPPRVTRAERLRRKAREAAAAKAESLPTSPGMYSLNILIFNTHFNTRFLRSFLKIIIFILLFYEGIDTRIIIPTI